MGWITRYCRLEEIGRPPMDADATTTAPSWWFGPVQIGPVRTLRDGARLVQAVHESSEPLVRSPAGLAIPDRAAIDNINHGLQAFLDLMCLGDRSAYRLSGIEPILAFDLDDEGAAEEFEMWSSTFQ